MAGLDDEIWNDGDDGDAEDGTALRLRHDGFTPARQKQFLTTLAETGCVRDACRVAEVSSTTAYRTKRRLGGDFARQWEVALSMARSSLEILAWERGVTGIEEPVFHYGKFSHMRVKRSDTIFRLILQASNPRKYALSAARRAPDPFEEAMQDDSPPIDGEMVRNRIMRKLDKVRENLEAKGYRKQYGAIVPPGWRLEPIEGEEQGEIIG